MNIISKMLIPKLAISAIILTSCDANKNNHNLQPGIEKKVESIDLKYVEAHEKERKLYRLTSDLVLRDNAGREVAIIYKGAIIRKASIFDLETGDIGDNDLMALVIKANESSLMDIGKIHNADDHGVYHHTLQDK
jgi:hypothetical protein